MDGFCQNYISYQWGKNYENLLTFDNVFTDFVMSCFYGPQCIIMKPLWLSTQIKTDVLVVYTVSTFLVL